MTFPINQDLFDGLLKDYFIGPSTKFTEYIDNLLIENDIRKYMERAEAALDNLHLLRARFLSYRLGFDQSDLNISEIKAMIKGSLVSSSVETLLEAALIAVFIENEELAEALMSKCKELLGFEYETCGFMGRRSMFQEKDVAVLMVKVLSCNPVDYQLSEELPKNIPLNDDSMFDVPIVNGYESVMIGELECCLLIINAHFIDKFETRDDSSAEKIEAFTRKVFECSKSWIVQRSALHMRALSEASKVKFSKRIALQLKSLEEEFHSTKKNTDIRFTNLVILPTIWTLCKELGFALAKIGDFSNAAEKLERTGCNDQASQCYIQLGRTEKAIDLLRKAIDYNPHNYQSMCLLGDLLKDPSLYKRAYDLSNCKYFPALRAVGLYCCRKEQWAEALNHFTHLTINQPAQEVNWFHQGYCLMRLCEWDRAAESFNRVIAIDHDHCQAWNNLAAVHLHTGKLSKAHHALKMSVKLEFDNWRLWDNLFKVSLELGDLFECILDYQRLLELRGKEVGLVPFVLMIERLIKVSSNQDSIFRPLDCLVKWMDSLFSNDIQYFWAKSEYLKIKCDLEGWKECLNVYFDLICQSSSIQTAKQIDDAFDCLNDLEKFHSMKEILDLTEKLEIVIPEHLKHHFHSRKIIRH